MAKPETGRIRGPGDAGTPSSGLGGPRPRAATASPLLRRNPGRRGPDPRDSARYEGVPQHTDASVAKKRERNDHGRRARCPHNYKIVVTYLRGRGNLGRREDRLDVAWLDGHVGRARPHLLAAEAVVRELHQIGMDLVLGVRDHLVAALRL